MLGFIKRQLWPSLRDTGTQWSDDQGHMLAASLSYYAIFSLFPLLLVLISILGYALRFSDSVQAKQEQFLSIVADATSQQLADQVGRLLGEVKLQASVHGPIGLITLLFGAMGIFAQLELAFQRIWRSPGKIGKHTGLLGTIIRLVMSKLKAFLMMLALGALVVAAFVLSMVMNGVRRYAPSIPGDEHLWPLVEIASSVGFNAVVFAVVYKALSKGPARWLSCLGGGLLAALAWEVGRQALALFVIGEKYTPYGIVGSFIAILLWIYYASTILLIGATYVHVLTRHYQAAEFTGKLASSSKKSE